MLVSIFMLLGLIFGFMLNGWSKEDFVKRKETKTRRIYLSAMFIWCSVIVTGIVSIQ